MSGGALRLYVGLLALLAALWLLDGASRFAASDALALLPAAALYLGAHLARMLRLALLTLDQRERAVPLAAAHTLTAFPSSLLPFKLGELLRLAAFFQVYRGRGKALAVWLAERFGDVVVLTAFICALYLLRVELPGALRLLLLVFVLATMLGLLGLFAVAKTLVYLNRHLVLSSHSQRGLRLLRASHALRLLELDLYRSVEGRLAGFALLSILVWTLDIAALVLYARSMSASGPGFGAMFANALLANLPGGASDFGPVQSLVLAGLTLLCVGALYFASRKRSTDH